MGSKIESAVNALYDLRMPPIHRQHGWKVQIFANDHAPPHAHLVSATRKLVVEIASGLDVKGSDASARALAEGVDRVRDNRRSAENTSELKARMRIPYAVFC